MLDKVLIEQAGAAACPMYVPDYLLDAKIKEASKRSIELSLPKLNAMGNNNPGCRHGFKKKFKKDKDPLVDPLLISS